MLLDLYIGDKINFLDDRRFLGATNRINTYVQICNADLITNSIESFVFNILMKKSQAKKGLQELLLSAKLCGCAKLVLKNLRTRGVITNSERTRLFEHTPRRHSTINIGPMQDLERRIKCIALKESRPDSYMLSLLTLSLLGENEFSFVDKILERQLTKREYKVAKENLTVVVRTQATRLKSPKFIRKKYSRDVLIEKHEGRKESHH